MAGRATTVTCPSCRAEYEVSAAKLGTRMTCKWCGDVFPAEPAQASDGHEAPPSRRAGADRKTSEVDAEPADAGRGEVRKRVVCPSCQAQYDIPVRREGQLLKCRRCSAEIRPGSPETPWAGDAPADPSPVRSRGSALAIAAYCSAAVLGVGIIVLVFLWARPVPQAPAQEGASGPEEPVAALDAATTQGEAAGPHDASPRGDGPSTHTPPAERFYLAKDFRDIGPDDPLPVDLGSSLDVASIELQDPNGKRASAMVHERQYMECTCGPDGTLDVSFAGKSGSAERNRLLSVLAKAGSLTIRPGQALRALPRDSAIASFLSAHYIAVRGKDGHVVCRVILRARPSPIAVSLPSDPDRAVLTHLPYPRAFPLRMTAEAVDGFRSEFTPAGRGTADPRAEVLSLAQGPGESSEPADSAFLRVTRVRSMTATHDVEIRTNLAKLRARKKTDGTPSDKTGDSLKERERKKQRIRQIELKKRQVERHIKEWQKKRAQAQKKVDAASDAGQDSGAKILGMTVELYDTAIAKFGKQVSELEDERRELVAELETLAEGGEDTDASGGAASGGTSGPLERLWKEGVRITFTDPSGFDVVVLRLSG